jgi:hypothetical protein
MTPESLFSYAQHEMEHYTPAHPNDFNSVIVMPGKRLYLKRFGSTIKAHIRYSNPPVRKVKRKRRCQHCGRN